MGTVLQKRSFQDSTGLSPQKSAPDDHVEEIEEILTELVEDDLAGYECKIVRYVPGEGQFQWIVYLVTPRKQALAEWNGLLSAAKDELSRKEAEVAGHMEQFKGLSAIAANIHLLKKSGPVKEYREGKKQLEELTQVMAGLESKSRVQELGTYSYWVHEFPGRGKYAVYPYPSVLEVRTSSSGGRLSSLAILLSPQLEPKGKEVLHDLGVRLGEWVQEVYDWVDVHLDFSKSAMLYTIPLADARAEEAAARKELEKKPAEKKPKAGHWP